MNIRFLISFALSTVALLGAVVMLFRGQQLDAIVLLLLSIIAKDAWND